MFIAVNQLVSELSEGIDNDDVVSDMDDVNRRRRALPLPYTRNTLQFVASHLVSHLRCQQQRLGTRETMRFVSTPFDLKSSRESNGIALCIVIWLTTTLPAQFDMYWDWGGGKRDCITHTHTHVSAQAQPKE